VWYFANPSTPKVRDAMRDPRHHLGMIATPAQGNSLMLGVPWVADNGVFGGSYPGDDAYLDWLAHWPLWAAQSCRFAVAPDVVGDAAATLERSASMLPRIREYGIPVALAAQNGLEDLTVPWNDFDVLFLGGDTAWKLGPEARALAAEANARGKRVHMGRVNSLRRLRYAQHIGCHTADGTYLAFGPDVNLPKLLAWLWQVNAQNSLFSAVTA
jgi:hypothetical protein